MHANAIVPPQSSGSEVTNLSSRKALGLQKVSSVCEWNEFKNHVFHPAYVDVKVWRCYHCHMTTLGVRGASPAALDTN